MRTLSSGDRVLAGILACFVAIASLASIYALEQSFLIQVPAYGGTLREAEMGNPQYINPLLAISDADSDLSTLVYAGLMGLSGTGQLVPVLAERYTASADGKTYTFVLKKNAVFSDGTPVTAADVVFTVQKAQNAAIKSPKFADWSGVGVTALDARTVQFTLSKPYAPFLELTTLGIIPSRLWQNVSNEEFAFSTLQTSPIGAGPFKVQRVSRDATGLIKSVSLVENPRYVLGRPYLNGIRFDFYSQSEDIAQALASGAEDSAYDVGTKGALTAPYARVFGVFFNPSENKAYAQSEVRKALSLALDRQDIVTNVLGGYATPIMGPVPPGGGVNQTAIPASQDPTVDAAQVLESAGWTYSATSHVWQNAKEKQTLSAITIRTSNVPELKNVASAVKADWEKLGIPVDVQLYEPGDLSQNVIRTRQYEALLYGMVIGRDEDLYAFWDSQEINDPGLNIAQYANKTVDALLEDARSSVDAQARAADLQKIEDDVSADYPAAFLYAPDFTYAVPSDLRGVILPQIITPSDRFATVASWYRETDAVWPIFARRQ
ncbi:MAG: peptide ABC transporter substrate-binding protein [Minisyncoccia bacterium]